MALPTSSNTFSRRFFSNYHLSSEASASNRLKGLQMASTASVSSTSATKTSTKRGKSTSKKAKSKGSGGKAGGPTLVIVESPTKARTIERFLAESGMNDRFIVDYCAGHVRDLPTSTKDCDPELKKRQVLPELSLNVAHLGVDVHEGFRPLYVPMPGKKDVLKRLTGLAKECSSVLLATDEDREGEAISWHLLETLKLRVPHKRAVFHEITKQAILEAFNNPRDIDLNLVHSQETRRILDRLTGFTLSPVLWRYVAPGLSAGRVQSCGLALVAEREQLRWAFVPSNYYSLEAILSPLGIDARKDNDDETLQLPARLISLGDSDHRVATSADFDGATGLPKVGSGKTKSELVVLDAAAAGAVAQWLAGGTEGGVGIGPTISVTAHSSRPQQRRPPAAFITSSLQQAASSALGLSPSRTMQVAQDLYEEGFITYMRTDSVQLSTSAQRAANSLVTSLLGPEYVAGTVSSGISKGHKQPKNAQEAHEAIRPALVERQKQTGGKSSHSGDGDIPQEIGSFASPPTTGLQGPKLALYALIYR
jgi:DNA topoisomerase-1